MLLTQQKLEARTRQLDALRYADAFAITPLTCMAGGLPRDEVYTVPPAKVEGATLDLLDEFRGRDEYLWAQKKVALPPQKDGWLLCGLFDFGTTCGGHNSGFESLLYVNGQPYQGVDGNHQDVVLQGFAGQEVDLTFLMWTGLEGGGVRKLQLHRIQKAHIAYLHQGTDELYFLARAVVGTIALLDDTAEVKHSLTKALNSAFFCINWDEDKFYGTVGEALATLEAALAKIEKRTGVTVNAVGHTHIDVAWLWRLKHTREKAQRSFSTVLRLMEEFDDYVFLQTQPQLYKYVKNDNPALYERIKQRVAEGRWEADGGMWVEADCNISSGEALVRQLTHGIGFFKEEFGKTCEFLWLPDVFGYSWALPQILRLCNIKTFMTTKISWNQYNSIPHDLFTWRGIDGSEILTYFITTPEDDVESFQRRSSTYNGKLTPNTVWGSWYKFRDKELCSETLISYGHGDGGGGPTREMLKMRRAMDKVPGLPNVKQCRADEFFDRVHQSTQESGGYLHTWDGELYLEYHRGTYTSQGYNKKMNRRMELALAQAEWLNAQAMLQGAEYPAEALHDGWEVVLLHQFHDIIPGSSIREVYEDSDIAYRALEKEAGRLTEGALAVIAPGGGQGAGQQGYTLYHMGSFAYKGLALVPVAEDGVFEDESGKALPAQKTKDGWLVQAQVPALAVAGLRFTPGATPAAGTPFTANLEKGSLETPFYTLAWNQAGHFTSIYDKENSREVLAGKGNVLEMYEDKPLAFPNWDIDMFHMEKREEMKLQAPPALVEAGPLRAVLRLEWAYNKSTLVQDVILYSGSRRIDFACHADWQEEGRLMKAAFTVDVRSTKASYDIQFGHVERPTHYNTSWDWARFEVVGHKWADLSETGYGVSLLNDCKYGYSVKDNSMRITLLKSSKDPDIAADMGEHDFTYALLPHAGGLLEGDTMQESVALNLPLGVFAGGLAQSGKQLLRYAPGAVIIDAVKKAERDNCLVVRLHECRGGKTRLELASDYGLKAYAPCNLLEEELEAKKEGAVVPVELDPFQIKVFKLWF